MKLHQPIFQWPMLAMVALLVTACSKKCGRAYKKEFPYPTLEQVYDLDEDGIPDLSRCQMHVLMRAVVHPEGTPFPVMEGLCGDSTYSFLTTERENYYLKSGDRISLTPSFESDLKWRSGTYALFTNATCDGLYRETWNVVNSEQLPHYIAIKKEDSSGVQLGWIKLEYDVEAGLMNIAETELRGDTVLVFE